MGNNINDLGLWADNLGEEVAFTKKVAQKLRNCGAPWTKKFFKDQKIKEALQVQPCQQLAPGKVKGYKGALFEIRFAYMLSQLGLNPVYEYKTNMGNTSVDFKIEGTPALLVKCTRSCLKNIN